MDLVNLQEDQFESRLVAGSYASTSDGVAKKGFSSADRYVIDNFLTLLPDLGDRHEIEPDRRRQRGAEPQRTELHPG